MSLPSLYLTESGKEVIAPGGQGVIVDKQSGELAFLAYTCANPDCPGEPNNGRPYLFIWRDRRWYVKSDGTLGAKEVETAEAWEKLLKEDGSQPEPTCPACLELRKLDSESPEVKQKYRGWVQRYVLPKTKKQLEKLNQEDKRRLEDLERRRNRKR